MSEPDDIPNRVTRLEHEMREVRYLAVGANEDVSALQDAFRAQTGLLHALRQTQVEQGREIKVLQRRFDGMDQRFDGVDRRLDRMDQRFDGMDQRFDGMDQRLGRVEDRLARVDAGIAELLNRGSERPGEG